MRNPTCYRLKVGKREKERTRFSLGAMSRLEFCSQLATVVGSLPSRMMLETSTGICVHIHIVELELLKTSSLVARTSVKNFLLH